MQLGCEGSVPDPSSPGYEAWQTALNLKVIDDMATMGNLAIMMTPAGPIVRGIGATMDVAGLYTSFMRDELIYEVGSIVISRKFENYLVGHGVPRAIAEKIAIGVDIAGGFDTVTNAFK